MTRDEILTKINKLVIEYNKRDINLSQFADEVEKLFTNPKTHSSDNNNEPENFIHLGNYKIKLKGYFSEITINKIH